MRAFLSEDIWALDFAASAIFGIAMAAEFQIISDSGEKHPERILPAVGTALVSYAAAFLIGIAVRKRASFVRSWVWMSRVGALFYTAVVVITAYPMWLDYQLRFYPNSGPTPSRYLYENLLPGALPYFLMWAVPMAIFLIVVRFVFALGRNRLK